MTRPLGATKIGLMQDTQEVAMMDSCKIIVSPTKTTDSYNRTVETWNWASVSESICGFEANPKVEALNQVPMSDAIVRLPITTTINSESRMQITKRFGVAVSPLIFQVVGIPKQGPSGLRVWIRKVTDGS